MAELKSIGDSFAMIWFQPDGTIIRANQNFLDVVGYKLAEVIGKHHSIFLCEDDLADASYRQFWRELACGKAQTKEFRRKTKMGENVWIQASYMPVRDHQQRVVEVLKVATDITAMKRTNLRNQALLNALSKTQAVIEFDMSGKILDANPNFLDALGYRLDEVVGRHHRIFMDPIEREGSSYRSFGQD